MKNISPKLRKSANVALQLLIFGGSWYFIYNQIFKEDTGLHDGDLLLDTLSSLPVRAGFIPVILLMVANWLAESYKWQFMIRKQEAVSLGRAFQAVLAGISISTFTPNRTGDYLGRIFLLRTAGRLEGILITVIGSMAQLIITVVAGSIALLIFIPGYAGNTPYGHPYLYSIILIIVSVMVLMTAAIWFNLPAAGGLSARLIRKWPRAAARLQGVFSAYTVGELFRVLVLSAIRYAAFSTQYYLLIRMAGIEVSYADAIVMIALIYLVMTLIPTVALTELGIRGSVALWFFGFLTDGSTGTMTGNMVGVLAASVMLWVVNLGIPAMAGTFFLFRLQFFRKSVAQE